MSNTNMQTGITQYATNS